MLSAEILLFVVSVALFVDPSPVIVFTGSFIDPCSGLFFELGETTGAGVLSSIVSGGSGGVGGASGAAGVGGGVGGLGG